MLKASKKMNDFVMLLWEKENRRWAQRGSGSYFVFERNTYERKENA